VFKVCTRPPCCRILAQKIDNYLVAQQLLPSGINLTKDKFPDRYWLVLAVASLSNGTDEIFTRDYVPSQD